MKITPSKCPRNISVTWLSEFNWINHEADNGIIMDTSQINSGYGIKVEITKLDNHTIKLHYTGTATQDIQTELSNDILLYGEVMNCIVQVVEDKTKPNGRTYRYNCDFNKVVTNMSGIWDSYHIKQGQTIVCNAYNCFWTQVDDNSFTHFRMSPFFYKDEEVDLTMIIQFTSQPACKRLNWIADSNQENIAHNMTREDMVKLFKQLCQADPSNARTHYIRLGTTGLAKLTDETKKIATDKGWTLA